MKYVTAITHFEECCGSLKAMSKLHKCEPLLLQHGCVAQNHLLLPNFSNLYLVFSKVSITSFQDFHNHEATRERQRKITLYNICIALHMSFNVNLSSVERRELAAYKNADDHQDSEDSVDTISQDFT